MELGMLLIVISSFLAAPISSAAGLPLVDESRNLIPLLVQLGFFILLTNFALRLPSIRHLHTILVGSLRHCLLLTLVIRILFLGIEVKSAHWASFIALVHFIEVSLVIGVAHSIVHLGETRIALCVPVVTHQTLQFLFILLFGLHLLFLHHGLDQLLVFCRETSLLLLQWLGRLVEVGDRLLTCSNLSLIPTSVLPSISIVPISVFSVISIPMSLVPVS